MAFQLPIEVNIHIAAYLNDRDIPSFARACRETYNAIACTNSPLWRVLFAQRFDIPSGRTNNALKGIYQRRQTALRKYSHIRKGLGPTEKEVLETLRDLIVESYVNVPKKSDVRVSNNIIAIEEYCTASDLLESVVLPRYFDKQTSPLLIAIQIILSHLRFDLNLATRTYNFPESQFIVYRQPHIEPIFCGKSRTEINLRWVLHGLNFFKHYCTTAHAALEANYSSLPKRERIRPWTRSLLGGHAHKLAKAWKGVYAYLDDPEIWSIRSSTPPDDMEDRWCDSNDIFQSLQIDHLDPGDRPTPWHPLFETNLHALDHPSLKWMMKQKKNQPIEQATQSTNQANKDMRSMAQSTVPRATRAQIRNNPRSVLQTGPDTDEYASSKSGDSPPYSPREDMVASRDKLPLALPFQATGEDEESFLAAGWVSALPPQQGIPGWQRFTMMKFFVPEPYLDDDDISSLDLREIADLAVAAGIEGLWAYEGVVLPGGNVIVGRWWSPASGDGLGLVTPPTDQTLSTPYSGPFLWWAVD